MTESKNEQPASEAKKPMNGVIYTVEGVKDGFDEGDNYVIGPDGDHYRWPLCAADFRWWTRTINIMRVEVVKAPAPLEAGQPATGKNTAVDFAIDKTLDAKSFGDMRRVISHLVHAPDGLTWAIKRETLIRLLEAVIDLWAKIASTPEASAIKQPTLTMPERPEMLPAPQRTTRAVMAFAYRTDEGGLATSSDPNHAKAWRSQGRTVFDLTGTEDVEVVTERVTAYAKIDKKGDIFLACGEDTKDCWIASGHEVVTLTGIRTFTRPVKVRS